MLTYVSQFSSASASSSFPSSSSSLSFVLFYSSAYGAGTVAGGDGSRQPVPADLAIAKHQGSYFAGFVGALVAGRAQ